MQGNKQGKGINSTWIVICDYIFNKKANNVKA